MVTVYGVIRNFLFFVGGLQLFYLFGIEDNRVGRNYVICSYKLGVSRPPVLGYRSRYVFT